MSNRESIPVPPHPEKTGGEEGMSINVRHALERCTTLSDYFREIHTHVNASLTHNTHIRQTLSCFEQKNENILDAVVRNDFSGLECSPTSEEYQLALQLTATKNRMIASAIEEHSDIAINKLGLTLAEWQMIKSSLAITPAADEIYVSWRANLYPPLLRKQLESSNDPEAFLKKKNSSA